jgi:hypothetical protein
VRRSALLIAGVALALATAGCGGSGSSPTGGTHSTSPSTGPTTPSSAATTTIDPNFDNGQIVQVTTNGLRPKWLVSILGKAVTWQNLTHHGIKVVFDHEPVASRLIPPGGSFSYKPPTAVSITYHVTAQPTLHGAVQVTPGATP